MLHGKIQHSSHNLDSNLKERRVNTLMILFKQPIPLLFLTIALGILIGQIPFGKIKLGGSGVLVAGLLLGHFGFEIPKVFQTLGVVFFVYAVGLKAGPYFFDSLKQSKMAILSMVCLIGVSSAVTVVFVQQTFDIPPDLSVGIYSGAMTSTPALAAAIEVLGNSSASVGYGLAYPLGILIVILGVQIFPPLLRIDLKKEEVEFRKKMKMSHIVRTAHLVENKNLTDRALSDVFRDYNIKFRIVRIKRDSKVFTPYSDSALKLGDVVSVVGEEKDLKALSALIGKEVDEKEVPYSEDAASRWVTISSKKFVGRKIGQLEVGQLFGVIVTRIKRGGIEFVPTSDFVLEASDDVRISGTPKDLQAFDKLVTLDPESLHQTDIFSMTLGLVLGVLVGFLEIPITAKLSLSLGVAGGPLVVGILFGYMGRFGRIVGYMPKAATFLLGEFGLYIFLAVAGCSAGATFVDVLKEQGVMLILAGAIITAVPILVSVLIGYFVLRINFLFLLGLVCGGMTSTPALGVLSSNTKSDVPTLGYTAIYPFAVLVTTLIAQLIASI